MKSRSVFLAVAMIIGLASISRGGETLPAFPGAEGWGADTKGGRGGKVIIVENLNDAGPGSFRAALQATGPRIIVFRTSGVIKCDKKDTVNRYINLKEENSQFTVAGQTSPGGITLTGDKRAIVGCSKQNVHDFVIRHLRFRVVAQPQEGIDGVGFNGASNFVLDHCDFSGGTDGTLDITYGKYFTLQWNTIANSFYQGGDHGGSLIAYPPTHHITMHHNLWAHHESRCGSWFHWKGAHPEDNGLIDYRNNICYNGVKYAFVVKGLAPVHVNMVGNTIITGPDSLSGGPKGKRVYRQVMLATSDVYEKDNLLIDRKGERDTGEKIYQILKRVDEPHEMPAVTTTDAKQNYEDVLNKVGAWPRDAMNDRVVEEVRTLTGKVKNHEAPFIEKGPQPPADTDLDGMPDFWEKAMKLNPNDAADNAKDHDGDGYTNIEEYINDLALARQKQDYYNPVYPIPGDWPDHAPESCKQIEKK